MVSINFSVSDNCIWHQFSSVSSLVFSSHSAVYARDNIKNFIINITKWKNLELRACRIYFINYFSYIFKTKVDNI